MAAEEQPTILAQEATNSVTTLAVAPEVPRVQHTVVLERQRIIVEAFAARRDLHAPNTKAWDQLHTKYEALKAAYDNAVQEWQVRKEQAPVRRLESAKKRVQTMAKKQEATVERILAAVESVTTVKQKAKLALLVKAALEPPEGEKPKKKRARVSAKAVVIEEEDD